MGIFRKKAKEAAIQEMLPGMPPPTAVPPERKRLGQFPLKESSVSRRSFLMRALAWTTAAIGGVLAAMGLGAITAPALRSADVGARAGRDGGSWCSAGAVPGWSRTLLPAAPLPTPGHGRGSAQRTASAPSLGTSLVQRSRVQ